MKKKNQDKIGEPFVPLLYSMMESSAYKQLTKFALLTLNLCMRKVKTNNTHDRYSYVFELTYAEAKRYGIHNSAFDRAMKQLHAMGFIDVVERGGLRHEGKACSRYRLSRRYRDYGTPQFKERHEGYSEVVHGR